MAGEDLYSALSGLNYAPEDNGYALGAQIIGAGTPALYNPYQSTGTTFGISLGSALLQGILGFQARRQAAEDSLEANKLGLQLLQASTPEARLAVAESAPDATMQSKLLALNTRMAAQAELTKALVAQKVAEKEGMADFELGPKGTELFNRELAAKVAQARALRELTGAGATATPAKKDWWDTLTGAERQKFGTVVGQTKELRNLAEQFRALEAFGPELRLQGLVPGSPADLALSKMNALVPSTARLLGEVGNLAQQEQERLIEATLGSSLSGSESIAKRLEQLAATSESAVRNQMETYNAATEGGGNAILGLLSARGETEAQKRNRELKEKLARLEALAAQRK